MNIKLNYFTGHFCIRRYNSGPDICYYQCRRKHKKCVETADDVMRHGQPDRGQQMRYYTKRQSVSQNIIIFLKGEVLSLSLIVITWRTVFIVIRHSTFTSTQVILGNTISLLGKVLTKFAVETVDEANSSKLVIYRFTKQLNLGE